MSNTNPSGTNSPVRDSSGVTSSELHAWLSEDHRMELTALQHDQVVPAGTRLVVPGIRPGHLAILKSGAAEISLQTEGGFVPLGLAGPGSVFDLRAIVCDEMPGVEVVCREQCVVSLVPREEFTQFLKRRPGAYFAVAKVLSSDLRTADNTLRQLLMASTRGGKRNHAGYFRPASAPAQ